MSAPFQFKHFSIHQNNSALKVGTDAMILGALAQKDNAHSILDVGAGTGVLTCMLLQKYPSASAVAIEIEGNAIQDLKLNLNQNQFQAKTKIQHLDFLTYKSTILFDLVVCNPPFYENGLTGHNEELNLAKHVNRLSIPQLLLAVNEVLSDDGLFYFIWPRVELADLQQVVENAGLFLKNAIEIYGSPTKSKRWVLSLSKIDQPSPIYAKLTIRNEKGDYTQEYKDLTVSFHGKKI